MKTQDDLKNHAELIEKLVEQTKALPSIVRGQIETEIEDLVSLLRDKRPPRFMLVGRRGSGKGTLINALFGSKVASIGHVVAQTGAGRWLQYEKNGKSMEILDTRGLQEGSKPLEADTARTATESILHSVQERCPDVILFLCKATEVDAAIGGDLAILETILKTVQTRHGRRLPIVGVLTQCDQLDPVDVRLPAIDVEKSAHIEEAHRVLERHLTSRTYLNELFVRVIPVAAWARYRDDGTIDPKRDHRWNIDELARVLIDELPLETKLDFARLARVRDEQRRIAWRVVQIASGACGIIGAEPIPFADLPILTSIQVFMILAVGYVGGCELSLKTARDFMVALGANVGAGFAFRQIARGLIKLIPGMGEIISGAVAAAGTYALGGAAIAYFIEDATIDEARTQMQENVGRQGRTSKRHEVSDVAIEATS